MLENMLNEFYSIGKSLSSEMDPLKLFDKIANSSMKLTSADACTIYIVVDKKTEDWSHVKNDAVQGKLLKFIIARNASMEVNLQDFSAPISQKSIFGYTVISGNSLRIDDAYAIKKEVGYRHSHSFDKSTGYKTKSILSIPMKNHNNEITGVIQLINKKHAWDTAINFKDKNAVNEILPFNDTDELIMNSLAGQAAVALENSKLYKGMQDLLHMYEQQNSQLLYLSKKIMKAHEEERKRIAREIHDGPAQSAVNLSLKLEICKKLLSTGKLDMFEAEINKLHQLIHSSVNEIRTIIYDLKPSCLEDGLKLAIERYIDNFSTASNIHVDFHFTGDDTKIEYYLMSTLYRIIQEALTNVKKHAEAKNINIDLAQTDSIITLDVVDDGIGFIVDDLKTRKFDKFMGGFGLEGIRERVELVRGSTTLDSAPGKGTGLHIKIPVL